MTEFEVEFEYEKDTKNTYRFQEIGQPAKIGALYVQKWVFEEQPPQKLTVKVTAK